jgi:nucleoid DNA-binding protein
MILRSAGVQGFAAISTDPVSNPYPVQASPGARKYLITPPEKYNRGIHCLFFFFRYNPVLGGYMNKNELISKIAEGTGAQKASVEKAVNSMVHEIATALKKKQNVTLVGFGTFKVVDRKARMGINPKTGEKIKIKATRVPKFVAGKELKNLVKK